MTLQPLEIMNDLPTLHDKVLIKAAFKIGAKGNAQKNPFMLGGRSR